MSTESGASGGRQKEVMKDYFSSVKKMLCETPLGCFSQAGRGGGGGLSPPQCSILQYSKWILEKLRENKS